MMHNHNTLMEVLQKINSSTNHINNSYMLDQYANKNESNKVDQDNKQDNETKYFRDDQNNNNKIDKNKNGLDQDRNKSEANVVDNINDDQYN